MMIWIAGFIIITVVLYIALLLFIESRIDKREDERLLNNMSKYKGDE